MAGAYGGWRLAEFFPGTVPLIAFVRMRVATAIAMIPDRPPKFDKDDYEERHAATPRMRQSVATDVPPHFSGATSASVSENVHWWPARSSAVYCRSPYSKSVGSMMMRAPWSRDRS